LVRQVEGFALCLSSRRSDGSLSKLVVITNDSNLFGVKLAWGETIHFGNLEFITGCFDNLSLSTEWNDLGAVFVGMAHSGSLSLHALLE
jgi:hypothetical protein